MSDDRDPSLQELFAVAKEELPGEAFMSRTMSEVDRLRRRVVIGWSCIGLVLAVLTWLLAAALQEAVMLLSQSLNLALVDIDNQLIAEVLSPLNSVASVAALGFLVLFRAFRKIFA